MKRCNDPSNWQILDVQGHRKYLNDGERKRFLAAVDELPPAIRALCLVMAYSGCRVSEALALTTHHVDGERGALTFQTLKRRRVTFRMVPVPRHLVELLSTLPVDAQGRYWRTHRVTVWRIVRALMAHIGIAGPMRCPKGLRHAFGICAATRNVPASLIQRWMGHASTKTTAIYLDAVGPEEREFAARMW